MKKIKVIECSTEDRNIEEYHQRRQDRNNMVLFSKVYRPQNLEHMYPYSIEIETINRCNNNCSFCAVNRINDSRKLKWMSESLFFSIIDQLAEIDYGGYLSLFSNNEPLLDTRICEFIGYARKKLPRARLSIFTNGILLTEEIFLFFATALDYLVIDNYNDEMKLLPSVEKIVRKYRHKKFSCDISVFIRKKTQIRSSRGGEAPNRQPDIRFEGGCMMPFMQIVVRPDGKISKCCQDGLGLSETGNLQKQTLAECWNDHRRKEIWKDMVTHGRGSVEGCAYCDVFGQDNYLPPEWRPMIISAFLDVIYERYFEKRKPVLVGGVEFRKLVGDLLRMTGIRGLVEINDTPAEPAEDCFYILETYDDGFLSKLDPRAEYAGIKWIVAENISSYIERDVPLPAKILHRFS